MNLKPNSAMKRIASAALKHVDRNLKSRIISAFTIFSATVFIVTLGGFFYLSSLLILALLVSAEYFRICAPAPESETKKLLLTGICAIAIPTISLANLALFCESGMKMIFYIIIIISSFDTFAYFTGKKLGKTKLAPIVSPNKTVEGLLGGLGSVFIISLIMLWALTPKIGSIAFIVISLMIATLAQIGDLVESAFKRKFNVKDSGNIIPGHGGFMDRLDSYLFAPAFLFVCYLLFKVVFNTPIF